MTTRPLRRILVAASLLLFGGSGCAWLIGFPDYELGASKAAGGGGSDGAGAISCEPGALSSCYSGPEGTERVGMCHQGVHLCNAAGDGYGECANEATPMAEDCATPEDDDCDGQVNQATAGCLCAPNASTPCYAGPAGTEGVSPCAGGVKTCNPLGTAYGPCVGEVLPAVEKCATLAKDENCDGTPACTGAHRWSKRFGDATSQYGYGIAVDGAGNVLVTGFFQGTVDFGQGPLTSAGSEDLFVAKFDPAGNPLWSKRFGDTSDQEGRGIAVDGMGNVLVTGYFQGTVDFGQGPLTSAGLDDLFVAKFDPAGNPLWSKRFGDTSDQLSYGIAVDGAGNVLVTGFFAGTLNFGQGTLTSAGAYDLIVAKFDPAGNPLWSKRFGDTSFQQGFGIAVDGAGNVLVTGWSYGTTDFGGGPLTNAGSSDAFLVKLAP